MDGEVLLLLRLKMMYRIYGQCSAYPFIYTNCIPFSLRGVVTKVLVRYFLRS